MCTEKTVLCVDDDPGILAALERVLRRSPCNVKVALGPEAGLEEITKARPDLILVDMKMPGIDGKEFVRRARAAVGDVPVVFITGIDALDAESRALSCDYYIRKPFSNHYVRNVVELMTATISADRKRELELILEGA